MSHSHGITNNQTLHAALTATDRTAALKSSTTSSSAVATSIVQSSASTTNLSGAGTLLATADTDDVRADKVAALKSAIDSGTYNVPVSAVADKLIDHLLG
jgi:flagellar biosynthesis anti-sigma factor FlgM